jgi:hypothetical protein
MENTSIVYKHLLYFYTGVIIILFQQPLLHKEVQPTKRKAEVLSKESGKIGVTIKTSPDTEKTASSKVQRLETPSSVVSVSNKVDIKQAPLSPDTPASRPESNIPPAELPAYEETPKKIINNNNIQNHNITLSPKAAPPRLWLPGVQKTDQVFITDVTVNLETVTIRECKTERGFFKEREMKSDIVN